MASHKPMTNHELVINHDIIKYQDIDRAKTSVNDANKLVNGWNLLKTKEERYDQAIPLYITALNIYKKYELWDKAIFVQLILVDIYQKIKDSHEEILALTQVAKLYKKTDTDKAVEYFTKVIEKNNNSGRNGNSNAVLWKEIGETLESEKNIEDKDKKNHVDNIIKAYTKSAEVYAMDNKPHTANNMMAKVCDVCIKYERYEDASKMLDDLIMSYISSSSGNYVASISHNTAVLFTKTHMFNAILCSIASKNLDDANNKLTKYQRIYHHFLGSSDDIFLSTILVAVTNNDEIQFKDAILSRDKENMFDDATSNLLLRIVEIHFDPDCRNCMD